ncbi:MAG TPA: prolyl oligopeptidase family serine peptidase, partial [Pirellulales bacterium]|nr:prolyl oligopeptidase family serine peptidase [Pirellulales bacterium]
RASAKDEIERSGCRPDFLILAYPAISISGEYANMNVRKNLLGDEPSTELIENLSNEKMVTPETPPTFLFHTDEDNRALPEHSVLFYMALRKAKVPAELHIFERGRHGVGLGADDPALAMWPVLCANWLRGRGLLNRPPAKAN